MRNCIGVEIPEMIEGLNYLRPYDGIQDNGVLAQSSFKQPNKKHQKIVNSLEEAIRRCGIKDGMTISFHHHFRAGDYIVNMVLDTLAKMGIRDLTLAASSLSDCHSPLIEHIKNGVIRKIETSGMRGELADAVSKGLMDIPVVFRSHGGRAYAIAKGELKIDIAFLGAPSSDCAGNVNGFSREGDDSYACGSLGYAMVDAQYAEKVIVLTNNLVAYPNTPCSIPETNVNYVVPVEKIGDPKGIASGATRYTNNPKELMIAQKAAEVMEASGYFNDDFSFQTGTGGAALAVTRFLRDNMLKKGINAGFVLGGITGAIVGLHKEGLIKKLMDVQSFDLDAIRSIKENFFHCEISALQYAGCGSEGSAVEQLDMVVLSALEIDTDFNVNVITGSDGVIRGAVGGHQDTASGAKLSIIVAPSVRGRLPVIVDRVTTIVTPGNTVDVLVTDIGVAVNPLRQDLIERLTEAGLKLKTISQMKQETEAIVGIPRKVEFDKKIVGVLTYRDGSVIDLIYKVK
ncbi:MAG TPA: citrate lyase subunit alpha [Thermoanaerobacterales bacterium]|nr:citrate lyase subunit alpha [Thermoanaerobacterales bacterium]